MSNNTPDYWLPEWWDLPTPSHEWHRTLKMQARPPDIQTPAVAVGAGAVDIGGRGSGPPGPPPAAAAAVQVTDEELQAIKRRRRQSREKRLRR